MKKNELIQKVKQLNLPLGQYALFGSAPLVIRGLRDCQDIDILMTRDLWRKHNRSPWELKTMPLGDLCLAHDEIELWFNWRPGEWDCERLIKEAEIIGGLPFVRLENVLAWKKISGRDKDLKDIEILKKYLKSNG